MKYLDWDPTNKCFFQVEVLSKTDVQIERNKFVVKTGVTPEEWLDWFRINKQNCSETIEEEHIYFDALLLEDNEQNK